MSVAAWAERYCAIGLVLTWTAPGQKGPRHAGWNHPANAITTPAAARRHWSTHPTQGIAALLGPSRLVSLDVDDEDRTRRVLEHFGVDLDELRRAAPCIAGRHFRLMYRAPDVELRHRTLAWPKQENPGASSVILELRAGAIADTLAPTLHPGTGRPYRWENPPCDGIFPPLPERLLELWQDWTQTSRAALALCPWAPAPKDPARPRARARPRGSSVIHEFNSRCDIPALLEAHGYQKRGNRFLAPETEHAPGIVVLPSGRVYCHHASDALGNGHAHDAFSLFAHLEHGDDVRLAVRAAAQALGMRA